MKTTLLLFLTCLLVACGKKATPQDKEAIESVISRNITAYYKLDLKEAKATTAGLDSTIQAKIALGSMSNFSPSFESATVESFSDSKATLKVVIYQKSLDSMGTDERETSTYTMVKGKKGEWLVSEIESIDTAPVVK